MNPRWLSHLAVERNLAETTIKAYRREIEHLEEGAFGPLDSLGTEELRTFVHERGGSASTVGSRIAALRSYYGFLVLTDERPDDPTTKIRRPKVKRGVPRPIADVGAKLAKLTPDLQFIMLFLVDTGLRIQEACDIGYPEPLVPPPDDLIVKGKGSKERVLPLTDTAWASLSALGGRIAVPGRQKRAIQRAFQRAGFKAHDCRHSFASVLVERGVPIDVVSTLLGHSSVATTQIYAEVSRRRLRRGMGMEDE